MTDKTTPREPTRAEIDAADNYWRAKATHNGEQMFALPGDFFWCELIHAVLDAAPEAPPLPQPASVDLDVDVTQEDRDAAAAASETIYFANSHSMCEADWEEMTGILVPAFCNHRIKSALARTSHAREAALREVIARVIDPMIRVGEASPFWDDNQVQMFRDAREQILTLLDQPAQVQPVAQGDEA